MITKFKIDMKRYIVLLLALFPAVLGTSSCEKFLSTNPTEIYSEDLVWGSQDMVEKFVMGNYNAVFERYTQFKYWEECFTVNVSKNNTCPNEARGLMDNTYDWGLNSMFTQIRNCNLILEKVPQTKVIDDAHRASFIAEAKMMRAMIYFDLARRGGKYMWVDKVLTVDDNFEIPLTKDLVESYSHILKDLREAVVDLPATSAHGRLNRNAGLTLLSQVCLTAAAYTNDAASLRKDGKSLYQEAVDAVDAIKGVSLDPDYGSLFDETGRFSDEIFLAAYQDKSNTTIVSTDMIRLIGNCGNDKVKQFGNGPEYKTANLFQCWNHNGPSQNTVNDYLVIDQETGKAVRWDESSQFTKCTRKITKAQAESRIKQWQGGEITDESVAYELIDDSYGDISDLIYSFRDARFDATCLHDKSTFYGEYLTMNTHGNYGRWYGWGQMVSASNYMFRKAIYTNLGSYLGHGTSTDYHKVIFRYGTALLNKTEALLQMNKVAEAVATLNQTRTVHGKLPASESSSLKDAWADYKRERRIELIYEGDWYLTQLRWGMYGGAANDDKPSKSSIKELETPDQFIEINEDRDAFFIGNVGNLHDQRKFDPTRQYLFPITKSVINANPAITDKDQNPGWE